MLAGHGAHTHRWFGGTVSGNPGAVARPKPKIVYGGDDEPGIRRRGRARVTYTDDRLRGRVAANPETLARIKRLAVPPAWTDVWISADPSSHIQATGRDARGRKQYRYHSEYRARRDVKKFDQLVPFGQALP